MNSIKLDKKERDEIKKSTTGKAWGSMDKVELTDELKRDLKTIKFRNQIFPKRFYKNADQDTLPTFFQIGTIQDNSAAGIKGRLTKKMQKKSIAQQFLMDDEASKFSKRKYETLNDSRRRMGKKKAAMKNRNSKRISKK